MQYNETFDRSVRLFPAKIALVDGERRFTYGELGERSQRLAGALRVLGLKKGDRLGYLLKNCAEIIEAYAAGAQLGVVLAGINYRLDPDGMRRMIDDTGCRVLLVGVEFVERARSLAPQLESVERFVSVGVAAEGMLEYEVLLREASRDPRAEPCAPADLAVITYTTGTTGAAKGAMATRANMVNRLCHMVIEMGIEPDDVYVAATPLFHVAIVTALLFVFRGGTVILMKDWDLGRYCQLLEREKVTKGYLVPTMLNLVLDSAEAASRDLTRLRLMLYGGAPMPVQVLKKCVRRLPSCKFMQAYGSSECYSGIILRPEEHDAALGGSEPSVRRMGSCGREGILCRARVLDDDGRDVEPGHIGEIVLGGASVMPGYWNEPRETEQALRDGWWRSGDLATVDEEGYVYIVDRKSHKIITGGENVYPVQVEEVLFTHPKIAEAVVIGVPDERWGEAVKAIVTLKPGEALSEQEVMDYCRGRMVDYARPKSVDFVSSIPYTATGKVDKLALKKRYWPARDEATS